MNEIITKQTTELSTDIESWGVADNCDSSDIVLGRINLVQGQGLGAELIADSTLNCKAGQYWDMQAREFLGSNEATLELCIFYSQKYWAIYSVQPNDKLEFIENVDFSVENSNWRFDAVDETGAPIRRNLCYRFYCLKANDPEGLPYLWTLTKSNTRTARLLITQFKKLKQLQNLPSAAVVIQLSSELVKNEEGAWFAPRYKIVGNSTPELIAAAKTWYDQITTIKAKVATTEVHADDCPF